MRPQASADPQQEQAGFRIAPKNCSTLVANYVFLPYCDHLFRPAGEYTPECPARHLFAFIPTAKTLPSPQVLCQQKSIPRLVWNPFHRPVSFAIPPRLSGWQRQTLYPPQHPSEHAPREIYLREQYSVVTAMSCQPLTGFLQPPLQAG